METVLEHCKQVGPRSVAYGLGQAFVRENSRVVADACLVWDFEC